MRGVRCPEAPFAQYVHCCAIKKKNTLKLLIHGTKLSKQKLKIHQVISLALNKPEFDFCLLLKIITWGTLYFIQAILAAIKEMC